MPAVAAVAAIPLLGQIGLAGAVALGILSQQHADKIQTYLNNIGKDISNITADDFKSALSTSEQESIINNYDAIGKPSQHELAFATKSPEELVKIAENKYAARRDQELAGKILSNQGYTVDFAKDEQGFQVGTVTAPKAAPDLSNYPETINPTSDDQRAALQPYIEQGIYTQGEDGKYYRNDEAAIKNQNAFRDTQKAKAFAPTVGPAGDLTDPQIGVKPEEIGKLPQTPTTTVETITKPEVTGLPTIPDVGELPSSVIPVDAYEQAGPGQLPEATKVGPLPSSVIPVDSYEQAGPGALPTPLDVGKLPQTPTTYAETITKPEVTGLPTPVTGDALNIRSFQPSDTAPGLGELPTPATGEPLNIRSFQPSDTADDLGALPVPVVPDLGTSPGGTLGAYSPDVAPGNIQDPSIGAGPVDISGILTEDKLTNLPPLARPTEFAGSTFNDESGYHTGDYSDILAAIQNARTEEEAFSVVPEGLLSNPAIQQALSLKSGELAGSDPLSASQVHPSFGPVTKEEKAGYGPVPTFEADEAIDTVGTYDVQPTPTPITPFPSDEEIESDFGDTPESYFDEDEEGNTKVNDAEVTTGATSDVISTGDPKKSKEKVAKDLEKARANGDNPLMLRAITALGILAGHDPVKALEFAKKFGAEEGWYNGDTNTIGTVKLQGQPQHIDTDGDGKVDTTGYLTGQVDAKGKPLFSTDKGLVSGSPVDLTADSKDANKDNARRTKEALKAVWDTKEGKAAISDLSSGAPGARNLLSLTKAIRSEGTGGIERSVSSLFQQVKRVIGVDAKQTDWETLTQKQQEAFVENFSLGVGVSNQDLKRYEQASGKSAWEIAQDPNAFLSFIHGNMRKKWLAGKRYVEANNQYWDLEDNPSLKVGNEFKEALNDVEEYLVSSGTIGANSSPDALVSERGKALWNLHHNAEQQVNLNTVQFNGQEVFGDMLDDQTVFNILDLDDPLITASAIRYYGDQPNLSAEELETVKGLKYLYASQVGTTKGRFNEEEDTGIVGLNDEEFGAWDKLKTTILDQPNLVGTATLIASLSPSGFLIRGAVRKTLGKTFTKDAGEKVANEKFKKGFFDGLKQWAQGRGLQRLGGGSLGGLKASGGKIKMIEAVKNRILSGLGYVKHQTARGAGGSVAGTQAVKQTRNQLYDKQLKKMVNRYRKKHGRDPAGADLKSLRDQAKDAAELIFLRQRGRK